MFNIVIAILICILVVLLIAIVRSICLKPTLAKEMTFDVDASTIDLEYGKRLKKMIQCNTVSNRFNNDISKFIEFHKVLEELFPNVHETLEKEEFYGNLLYKWKGKEDGEPILLMSHQDVVEANGKWRYDPFSGKIDDNRVWGRGTVDTKGNLFCIFQSIEELIQEGYVPKCDVYVASSCTEEYSGEGAPMTVEKLKEKGVKLKFMVDEGGLILKDPIVGVKGMYALVGVLEKGYGDIKLVAKGKGGHSSTPGKNSPLARVSRLVSEIDRKDPFKPKLNSTVVEMFRRFAPNAKFPIKILLANVNIFKLIIEKILPKMNNQAGAMIKTTIAFTMAHGSEGMNVLPNEAYIGANLRFIHHEGTQKSLDIVSKLAKKYDVSVEKIYTYDPCPVVDYSSNAFKLVEDVLQEIYEGIGVSPYVMTGGTDSKWYSQICDNCLRFAPLYIDKQQLSSIHGIDENVYIKSITKGVEFFKLLIKKI